MNENNYKEVMATIKKWVKTLFIVSICFAVISIILLIVYNFAGVFYLQTLPGTKYENGFTYPGWQSIYYGVGEMIIQGYTEFTFNIWNFLGLFVPLIALIVCSIMYIMNYNVKGTNYKKAVIEFIAAGAIIFGSIMLFNCDKFAIANASKVTDSYQNFYKEYLVPALNGELTFHKTFYPTLILIVGLLTGVIKIANGGLLIYQKQYAKKNKNK